MRSSLPSPSVSKSDVIQTSPLIQSAVLAEKTFCERPLTNVGTAGAGSGAGAAATAGNVAPFGGSGFAAALPTPTASANVTVIAPAEAKRLPITIQTPSMDPTLRPESVGVARRRQPSDGPWRAEISPHLFVLG